MPSVLSTWISDFFAWPDGGVWSNLIASALTVLPGLAVHHRRLSRKLDAHHARLERLAAAQPATETQESSST